MGGGGGGGSQHRSVLVWDLSALLQASAAFRKGYVFVDLGWGGGKGWEQYCWLVLQLLSRWGGV